MKPLSPVPLVVSGLLLTGAVFAENQAVEPATVNKSVNLALSQTQNNETKTTEKTPLHYKTGRSINCTVLRGNQWV